MNIKFVNDVQAFLRQNGIDLTDTQLLAATGSVLVALLVIVYFLARKPSANIANETIETSKKENVETNKSRFKKEQV